MGVLGAAGRVHAERDPGVVALELLGALLEPVERAMGRSGESPLVGLGPRAFGLGCGCADLGFGLVELFQDRVDVVPLARCRLALDLAGMSWIRLMADCGI